MKQLIKKFSFFFSIALILTVKDCFAQEGPGVEFNKYYYPTDRPEGTTQDQAHSGEDWIYDLKPFYESGKQIGFVGAGYSTYVGFLSGISGCYQDPHAGYTDFMDMEMDGYLHDDPLPKMVGTDINGKETWYKNYGKFIDGNGQPVYGGGGRFYNVIQDDENIVGVGAVVVGGIPSIYRYNIDIAPKDLGCNADPNTPAFQKGYIVKTDEYGNVIWQYLYGYDDENTSLTYHCKLTDITKASSGYFVVGNTENGVYLPFIMKLDENGLVEAKLSFAGLTGFGAGEAKGRSIIYDAATDNLFVVGTVKESSGDFSGFIEKLTYNDQLQSFISVDFREIQGQAGADNCAFDCAIDPTSHDLIVPFLKNVIGGFGFENFEGEGIIKIYRVAQNNLSDIGNFPITANGTFKAYDFQVGITLTSDGGFAIVSTKKMSNDPIYFCYHGAGQYPTTYWNTNGYVAKYSGIGVFECEKTIGEITPFPNVGSYAPPSNYGNVGNPKLQGDLKREECFYDIIECEDGGLAICGNNSNNFDDDVLIKLYPDCQTKIVYDVVTNNDTFHPDDGFVWNASNKVDKSVIVDAGKTFTITGQNTVIEFADTRIVGHPVNIIVMPGAILNITHGAKITSIQECPSTWEGVFVWGDPVLPQNSSLQGVVNFNTGATIEYAREGFAMCEMYYGWYPNYTIDYRTLIGTNWLTGGIIHADGANFINCQRSASFMQYLQPVNSNLNHLLFRSSSRFFQCNFIWNHYLPGMEQGEGNGMSPYCGVSMFDMHGVSFQGNTFKNQLPITYTDGSVDDRGTAIGTIDADFNVSRYCSNYTNNSGSCSSFQDNEFEGFTTGIIARFTNPAKEIFTLRIDQNGFRGNLQGVYVSGLNKPFTVTRNSFVLNDEGRSYGIYLDRCSNYDVEENHITAIGSYKTGYGIVVNGTNAGTSNSWDNQLYKNAINNCRFGTMSQYENANSATGEQEGLQFLCNQYTNNFKDIAVTPDFGSIKDKQGICGGPTIPAGNTFDYNCNGTDCNIYASQNVPSFTYYYHKDNTNFEPTNYSMSVASLFNCNMNPVPSYEEACPTRFHSGDSKRLFSMTDMEQWKTDYTQLKSLIDGGDKQQMLSYINNPNLSSVQIKNILLALSPYISDTILMAVIDRQGTPMTYNDLKDIIVNKSPLRDSVYQFLEDKRPAVANSYSVIQVQNGVAPMDILTGQLADLKMMIHATINEKLLEYGDSAEIDSSITLLQDNGEFLATLPYLIQKGDYEGANYVLENYGSNLSEEELQLNNWNIEKLIDSTGWNSIDSAQTVYLTALAESENALSANAKAILYLAKGIEYPEVLLDIDTTSESRNELTKKKLSFRKVLDSYFDISPNPSSGRITLTLQEGEWLEQNLKIEIYNSLGQKIKSKVFTGSDISTEINMNGFSPGVYEVRLRGVDGDFNSSKTLVLQ